MSTATGDTADGAAGQPEPQPAPQTEPTPAVPAEPRRRWFRSRRSPSTRIPLRRRRRLQRLGRVDGAAALPDPDGAIVTTDARRAMRNQLNADRAALWEAFHAEQTARDVELADVLGRLEIARDDAERARAALAEAEGRDPAAGSVQRGRGETAHGRPDELVARRRLRRHDREIAALTARRDATRRTVRELDRRRSYLVELSTGQRNRTVAQEHRLIGIHLTERAIYDRSLVGAHPDRDEISKLLDRAPPALSGWAHAALAEAEEAR